MINGQRVLAVTLARGGSKSIPKKNIAHVAGRPLISYTVSEALDSKLIDQYVVSTDCDEIANVVRTLGVENIIRRPESLATDTAKSSDALQHAVKYMEQQGESFDIVVELMVTNPLKRSHHIDEAIKLLCRSNSQFCVAVQRLYDHHPARIKYLDEQGIMHDFYPEELESRRQDLSPAAYIRAGSIYCMRVEALKNTGARYDKNNSVAYVLPDEVVVNIDEPIDMLVAEVKIRERDDA